MKTVLLLGAGLTRAASVQRPKTMLPPLDADFFSIAYQVCPEKAYILRHYLWQLVGGYSAVLTGSLEAATTHLFLKARTAQDQSPEHLMFVELFALLHQVLAKTTNPIETGASSPVYEFLRGELEHGSLDEPEDLTVITFNYDLLVERVLAQLAQAGHAGIFSFPGCYRLPGEEADGVRGVKTRPRFPNSDASHMGVAVLKLHGSLNWYSTHESRAPMPGDLFKTDSKIMVFDSPQIRDSLSLKKRGRTVYLQPVIIPPVSGKEHLVHESVGSLWQRAGQALQNADRLVIAGYSCPPMDIEARVLVSENLRGNRLQTVHVINPVMNIAEDFAKLCGVKKAIAYNNLEAFVEKSK